MLNSCLVDVEVCQIYYMVTAVITTTSHMFWNCHLGLTSDSPWKGFIFV